MRGNTGETQMISIRTIVHDRRIDVPAPEELPDGTEVVLELRPVTDKTGLTESEWDDSPDGVDEWLKWLDSLEPFILTDREVAEIEADRQKRKKWEQEQFAEHADRLAKEWE